IQTRCAQGGDDGRQPRGRETLEDSRPLGLIGLTEPAGQQLADRLVRRVGRAEALAPSPECAATTHPERGWRLLAQTSLADPGRTADDDGGWRSRSRGLEARCQLVLLSPTPDQRGASLPPPIVIPLATHRGRSPTLRWEPAQRHTAMS